MEKVKISNRELRTLIDPNFTPPVFPKYTTVLLNSANQFAQGTRPAVVGKMTDLAQIAKSLSLEEWTRWYLEHYPDALDNATEKIYGMIEKYKEAIEKIDKKMIKAWASDLVLMKTYEGLKFQEAILKKTATLKHKEYRRSTSAEESKGIDGYLDGNPVSIKPTTYKNERLLREKIACRIIYYEKTKDGIEFELED